MDPSYGPSAACTLIKSAPDYLQHQQVQIHVVDQAKDVKPSMQVLRASMKDPVIGVDIEWRADFESGKSNPVALIQLASSSVVILIRTCRLNNSMPRLLTQFCRDPDIVFAGMDWGHSDEAKMLQSFGKGREDLFVHFMDVSKQARQLGFMGAGVKSLAHSLWEYDPPKSRKVTLSNWVAKKLSDTQVRYAALDALLTGDLFRGLRGIHASLHPCMGCSTPLGLWPVELDLQCQDERCSIKHETPGLLLKHKRLTGHKVNIKK